MSVTQIANGTALIRASLATALAPLVGIYQGQPNAYWLQAPETAPLPLLVYQAQDGGGQDISFLNGAAWSGLFTIKALVADSSPSAADTLLAGVPAALAAMTVPGYRVGVLFVRDLVLPPRDFVYTAGLIYQIDLYA